MSDIQTLTNAILEAGVDIAPTYKEFVQLCFSIVDSCQEEGRPFFHRICELHPSYDFKRTDYLYTHCLAHTRGTHTLGTAVRLAQLAGVKTEAMKELYKNNVCQFASSQGGKNLTHYARDIYGATKNENCKENRNIDHETVDNSGDVPHLANEKEELNGVKKMEEMREKAMLLLPTFDHHEWPPFLQQMLDCAPSRKQADGLLLSAITVLGSTLNWTVHTHYGGRTTYPNLMSFIVGRPAAGKSVMGWTKQLAWPFHDALQKSYDAQNAEYKKDKTAWDILGKERKNVPMPEEPVRRMFIIPGNNSATGIKDNLIVSGGVGLIFETEADTMSSAISTDYGHWTDTLRKGYDNDEISFSRRLGNEYKQCQRTCISVLLTGTYGQVPSLIPSRTDGTLSRFLFYNLPPIDEWMDQFDKDSINYNEKFLHWGEGWKRFLDRLRANVSSIDLKLSQAQQDAFNDVLSRLFNRAVLLRDDTMKSAVARTGLNIVRMMCTVAFLRAVNPIFSAGDPFCQSWQDAHGGNGLAEALLASPLFSVPTSVPVENAQDGTWSTLELAMADDDFQAVLSLAEPLVAHSSFVIDYLPKEEAAPEPITEESFLQRLPIAFKREEALKIAEEAGLSPRKLDRILSKGVEKNILERGKNGFYTFKSKAKADEKKEEP